MNNLCQLSEYYENYFAHESVNLVDEFLKINVFVTISKNTILNNRILNNQISEVKKKKCILTAYCLH